MNLPRVIVIGGGVAGHEFPLVGETITIGRSLDNAIPFPAELAVSNHHARILARMGLFWLEDLNSANGTFLALPGGERFRLHPGEPVLLLEEALIQLAGAVTLQARGLIASQNEATRQALVQVQAFVGACYEQIARLSAPERKRIEERLWRLEDQIREAENENDLVRIVAEGISELTRTVACSALDEALPDWPEGLQEPGSPYRQKSVNNLFLSYFRQLSKRLEEKKR